MPEYTITTSFYTFRQNNVRGHFIINDKVAMYVIIEAMDSINAEHRFRVITEESLEYCPCCGERWEAQEIDGPTAVPVVYGVPAEDCVPREGSIIIHHWDGHITKLYY